MPAIHKDRLKFRTELELELIPTKTDSGLLGGAYAELFSAFQDIIDLIASQLVDEHLLLSDMGHGTCKSVFLQHSRRSPELALHRGWAKLMLGHFRDLVQHPNQPRPMAAESAVEDDKEAHAFYHHTHPSGYGVRPL